MILGPVALRCAVSSAAKMYTRPPAVRITPCRAASMKPGPTSIFLNALVVSSPFCTVTLTAAEEALFPFVSVARAPSWCVPFVALTVFQLNV